MMIIDSCSPLDGAFAIDVFASTDSCSSSPCHSKEKTCWTSHWRPGIDLVDLPSTLDVDWFGNSASNAFVGMLSSEGWCRWHWHLSHSCWHFLGAGSCFVCPRSAGYFAPVCLRYWHKVFISLLNSFLYDGCWYCYSKGCIDSIFEAASIDFYSTTGLLDCFWRHSNCFSPTLACLPLLVC